VRGLRDRRGWADHWQARMEVDELIRPPARWRGIEAPMLEPLPTLADLGLLPSRPLAPAGDSAAYALLEGGLAGRARGYQRALSNPLTAADVCSRLSPYLAFGTLSMRHVYQATAGAIRQTLDRALAQDLRAFASRLRWHCHFMQKYTAILLPWRSGHFGE
jgi:deoxyribodipyrimidine photo-lyase